MPSICLLESCWQEIHLDRLGPFGNGVACLQACCLTLSWQWIQVELQLTSFWEPVANPIGSRICALRWAPDLSVRKSLVSGTVWDGLLQHQTRTIQREEPLHPVHRRLAFCARQANLKVWFLEQSYAVSIWFGAGPTRNQTSRGDGVVDVPKNVLTWSAPSPKHRAIIPMFPFSSAWWPSDEWTFAMEFVTDNWVRVLS